MAHRPTKDDVRRAFANYQDITGDARAVLTISDPYRGRCCYQVHNAQTFLSNTFGVVEGAERAWDLLTTFNNGYLEAQRQQTRSNREMRDFQVICPTHGTTSLLVAEKAPERALCTVQMGGNMTGQWCNQDSRVVDSGRHDCHNYPDEGGCHPGTVYNHE